MTFLQKSYTAIEELVRRPVASLTDLPAGMRATGRLCSLHFSAANGDMCVVPMYIRTV